MDDRDVAITLAKRTSATNSLAIVALISLVVREIKPLASEKFTELIDIVMASMLEGYSSKVDEKVWSDLINRLKDMSK